MLDAAAVEAELEGSRYLNGYRLVQAAGGLPALATPRERLLGGRVLYNLGAERRARWLVATALRAARRDPLAVYFFSGQLWSRGGALQALRFVERFSLPADASDEERALILLRRAGLRAEFRDFERANQLADEAGALWQHPWYWTERAAIHARADRMRDGREAAERALAERPHYRPALQQLAQLLAGTDDRAGAIALLSASAAQVQSPYLQLQLAELCLQAGRLDEAYAAVQAATPLCPEPEAAIALAIAGLLAEIHYRREHLPGAATYLRFLGRPQATALAERLERGEPARRVELPVPHVRQDHKTCAPATLTALCRYWGHPAEHVEIVEQICHDGTPAAAERRWCEEQGLLARQFSVTWDAACALLDHGIPFALLTLAPGNAHLQAVIGYDARKRAFRVRDPGTSSVLEYDADELLRRQAFAGPRGLAIVPPSHPRAAALAAIALPDRALHDGLYAAERALLDHDRPRAQAACDALRARDPDHVVTLAAARALAAYDGNQAALLGVYDRLLARFPDCAVALLGRLACLEGLARPEARRDELWHAARRADADPLVQQLCARELARDGRAHLLAETWLLASARALPQDAGTLAHLATLYAAEARFDEAHACQRLAATLGEGDEDAQLAYFHYARAVGATAEALAYLEARTRTRGARAAGPWLTWVAALDRLDRLADAERALQDALETRPDDGSLWLAAARRALRLGDLDTARARLDRARGGARDTDRLRVAAEIARHESRRQAAAELWRQVLAIEPLALDAHAALVQTLREAGQPDAAEAHLRECVAAHPYHAGVSRLAVELRDVDSADGLAALQRLCELAPADAWARRELALRYAHRERLPGALAAAAEALALDPRNPASHSVHAVVLHAAQRGEEARAAYREAIRLDADHGHAIVNLVALCDTLEERRAALAFVADEMRRQTLFGDGLRAYQQAARGVVPDEAILDLLEQARAARPDLRAAHEAAIEQLIALERYPEARARVRAALALFPLVPDLHLLLARIERLVRDDAAEAAVLRRALEIEPAHPQALRTLAANLARSGERGQAIALVQSALARTPLDPLHHTLLADLQSEAGAIDDALATLEQALLRLPEHDLAWDKLADLALAHGRIGAAEEIAERVAAARPDSAAAHAGRARLLASLPGRADRALASFDRAIACAPRGIDAHDGKAVLLARLGRLDDALAACSPDAFGRNPPLPLQGRRAWILALRGPDLPRAVDAMQAVVEENPAYVFGHMWLAQWLIELGELRRAREHAERAFNLTGRELSAGLALLDVCLAQRDFARCEAVLADLHAAEPHPQLTARRAHLALARQDPDAALPAFASLCALPQTGSALVTDLALQIGAAGRRKAVVAIVEDALLGAREAPEWLGEVWAALHEKTWIWLLMPRRIPRLLRGGAAARAAVANLIESLAERKRADALHWMRWLWGKRLRAHARTWGAMGFALVQGGLPHTAERWLRDYARHTDARPWMLHNLSFVLRLQRDWHRAAAVVRDALALPPDHTTDRLRAWLALDLALAGKARPARDALASVSVPLDGFLALVRDATLQLCELREAGPVSRQALRGAMKVLERDHEALLRTDVGHCLRRQMRLATKRVWPPS